MFPKHPNASEYPKIKKPIWRHPFFCDWFCIIGPFRLHIYHRIDGRYDLLIEGHTLGTHSSLKKAKKEAVDWIRAACNEVLKVTAMASENEEVPHE